MDLRAINSFALGRKPLLQEGARHSHRAAVAIELFRPIRIQKFGGFFGDCDHCGVGVAAYD